MAGLDDIFVKSNLDENVKKAKMFFGRMLINLRKNNRIKLYSLLESVSDTKLTNNVMQITLSDKTAYDMINNGDDINVLRDALRTIQDGLDIEVLCDGKEEFDVYKFETFLKSEFGKLLTIKRD